MMDNERIPDDRPVILVVDDDPAVCDRVTSDLERRFGSDYLITAENSPGTAIAALSRWADVGRDVALIIAELRLQGMNGVEFLISAHEVQHRARRAVLVDFDDQAAAWPILRATTLGQVDLRIVKPWVSPEEWLYRDVGEALSAWWRENRLTFAAVTIIGEQWQPRCHGLRDILTRNPVSYAFHEPESATATQLIAKHGLNPSRLPIAILYDGRVLIDPTDVELAEALGMQTHAIADEYDLAIVGAGPAGLAAAVYATSEGLSTVVIESTAIGGQAGTSTMIRNYPGFPYGISGSDLTARAYEQARFFGTEFVLMREAVGLASRDGRRIVTLSDGAEIVCRTAIIALGVAARGTGLEALDQLYGAGVFYGSAMTEARALEGNDVFIVGAGNSGAQAALHLARYARNVTIVCRGDSLEESMSEYLIDAIGCAGNLDVRLKTQIVEAHGGKRLTGLVLEHVETGETEEVHADAVFIMVGSAPRTDWLGAVIALDEHGYVCSGQDLVGHGVWPLERSPMPLETSLPGVFAVGDVRQGSTKRASSAVGEGAAAVGYVHRYLLEPAALSPAAWGNR